MAFPLSLFIPVFLPCVLLVVILLYGKRVREADEGVCSRCHQVKGPDQFNGFSTCRDCRVGKQKKRKTEATAAAAAAVVPTVPPSARKAEVKAEELMPPVTLELLLVESNALDQLLKWTRCLKCQQLSSLRLLCEKGHTRKQYKLKCGCGWQVDWDPKPTTFVNAKGIRRNHVDHLVAQSFLTAGQYHATYEKVLETLGIPAFSKDTFAKVILESAAIISTLLEDDMAARRSELKATGKHLNWKCSTDGFYLTRGFDSANASAALYDVDTGQVLFRAHKCRQGKEANYSGSSKSMESRMILEMMEEAKKEEFIVAVVLMDGDVSSHHSVQGVFPKATIVRCNNHQSKNFHTNLLKITQFSCKCDPKCRRISQNLVTKAQKVFQALLGKVGKDYEKFAAELSNFPNHYTNQHDNCKHHAKEVDGKPYRSRIHFTCVVQKSEFEKLVRAMAANAQEYCSDLETVSTNQAESLHGMALFFRNKKVAIHAPHYKLKTDMAFLQRNLGGEWKREYFEAHSLLLPKDGLAYLEKVSGAGKKYKEKISTPAHRAQKAAWKEKKKAAREGRSGLDQTVFLLDSQDHGYKADDEEGEVKKPAGGERTDTEDEMDTENMPSKDFFNPELDLAVIFDEETTGKNPQADSIIQVAAKILETEEKFMKFIFTNTKIHPEAQNVHGISFTKLAQATQQFFDSVLDDFMTWLSHHLKQSGKKRIGKIRSCSVHVKESQKSDFMIACSSHRT